LLALGRVLKPACGEPVESVEGRSRTKNRGFLRAD
jgi:hypothetical protein